MGLIRALKNLMPTSGKACHGHAELHAYVVDQEGSRKNLRAEDVVNQPLPEDFLIEPGRYKILGQTYNCREPGIYRFYRLPDYFHQRLILPETINEALEFIGYLWAYGKLDNQDESDHFSLLKNSIPFLDCYQLTLIAQRIFQRLDVQSRLVMAKHGGEWNGYDDSHCLIEIHDKGKWFVYDPSFNCCIIRSGKRINLYDAILGFREEVLEIQKLPGNRQCGPWQLDGRDMSFWVSERAMSKESLIGWYKRVMQVPVIASKTNDNFYFDSNLVKEPFLEQFSIQSKGLSSAQFLNEFYP